MIIATPGEAITLTIGPVLDASGVAVTTSVVGDFKISKNGGAPAALNGSATLTHRHTGHYSLALTATDANTVGTAEVTLDDSTNACQPLRFSVGIPDDLLAYIQLMLRSDAGVATDRAGQLSRIEADEGSGAGSYDNTAAPTVVLSTAAIAAPTGVPSATAGIAEMIARLYQRLRNKATVTATKETVHDDSDVALYEHDLSDDGTTYTRTKANSV